MAGLTTPCAAEFAKGPDVVPTRRRTRSSDRTAMPGSRTCAGRVTYAPSWPLPSSTCVTPPAGRPPRPSAVLARSARRSQREPEAVAAL